MADHSLAVFAWPADIDRSQGPLRTAQLPRMPVRAIPYVFLLHLTESLCLMTGWAPKASPVLKHRQRLLPPRLYGWNLCHASAASVLNASLKRSDSGSRGASLRHV